MNDITLQLLFEMYDEFKHRGNDEARNNLLDDVEHHLKFRGMIDE